MSKRLIKMGEQYRLSEEGMQEALAVLEDSGFLPEAAEDENINTLALRTACEKYIDASRIKGDTRTDRECQDAMLVSFLQAHLEALVRRIIN
jgi:hypothetical protein